LTKPSITQHLPCEIVRRQRISARRRLAQPLPDEAAFPWEDAVKRLAAVTILGLLLGGGAVLADNHNKGKKHANAHRGGADVRVVWVSHDVEIIRSYYAPRYRSLPPGLQKKYARTGQLPPGWQKKMEPLPVAVERQCAPLPREYRRGVIDGRAVIYTPGGRIIDIAVLF
jgi:hypothetical protein